MASLSLRNFMNKNNEVRSEFQIKSLEKLKSSRSALIAKISEMKIQATRSDSDNTDPLDIASHVEEQSRLLSELARDEASLLKIESALRNFSNFGYCIECGEDIDERRLGIDPSICRCVDCQGSKEVLSRHMA
ncbi:hypothetical protein DAA48_16260 [Aeromonas veronii]|uniref:Zinc finger DksA/TraR C4-type domain-containing protein n=2 Tax=Aeromonadaceae TaxID=84642 RepID=A0A2T4MZZ9_AERVE|nr:hypothetical protein DAA48_16260 [Aeromonas veronii]